jgi:hypothetical protein
MDGGNWDGYAIEGYRSCPSVEEIGSKMSQSRQKPSFHPNLFHVFSQILPQSSQFIPQVFPIGSTIVPKFFHSSSQKFPQIVPIPSTTAFTASCQSKGYGGGKKKKT